MPRITLKQIEEACRSTIPEYDRVNNWHGYRSDGFPWKDLSVLGRVHLPGVGWLRTVESFRRPSTDFGHWDEDMVDVMIFKVDEDTEGKLFRKVGWRDSWDNYSRFDGDLDIVERYEKVVIDYRKVD